MKVRIPLREPVQRLVHDGATRILIPIRVSIYADYWYIYKEKDKLVADYWDYNHRFIAGEVEIKPPCQVGDELHLLETWAYHISGGDNIFEYKVDWSGKELCKYVKWNSPITMPTEAVRWKKICTGIEAVELSASRYLRSADMWSIMGKPDYDINDGISTKFRQWWTETYPQFPFESWAWLISW